MTKLAKFCCTYRNNSCLMFTKLTNMIDKIKYALYDIKIKYSKFHTFTHCSKICQTSINQALLQFIDVMNLVDLHVHFQWRRQGSRGGAKLISRVPSSSFPPIPSPSFLSLLPSLFSDISSPPFLFPIFPSQNPARSRSGGALQVPPAGLEAEPLPPKHFCHCLRPEDVLVAMILVLIAQIKISI